MLHHVHTTLEVPATLAAALTAFAYARGWLQIRRRFPRALPARRLAAFMMGLLTVWIAAGSPLAALHHELLTVHMVQHILLMSVASPLMLIGAPALPLLYGIPWHTVRGGWGRLLRSRLVKTVRRLLGHPAICWLAPTVVLIGWHVPAAFELAVRSRWWHDIQAASFLASGILFWGPVIHSRPRRPTWPRWSIPLYLFAATLPCDALSAFLVFCDRVVYPSYLSTPRFFNISPLGDQECAGALMWVAVTLIYLVPAVAVTLQLLSPAQMRARVLMHELPSPPRDQPEAEVG